MKRVYVSRSVPAAKSVGLFLCRYRPMRHGVYQTLGLRLSLIAWLAAMRRIFRNPGLATKKYFVLSALNVAIFIAGIGVTGAAETDAGYSLSEIVFHIPAQPLANALQAYGRAAGVQVLYESGSATGRISKALEGKFTRDKALAFLLEGTGLQIHHSKPDAVTLALPHFVGDRGGDNPPLTPLSTADLSIGELRVRDSTGTVSHDPAPLTDYSESVQADIAAALKKNSKTRWGSYRAVLDLWVNAAHTVERTSLVRSTGDQERDTAILATLDGLVTSHTPPDNAPQPVRVVIVVTSMQ